MQNRNQFYSEFLIISFGCFWGKKLSVSDNKFKNELTE